MANANHYVPELPCIKLNLRRIAKHRMQENVQIRSALISVYYKEGLDRIAKALHALEVKIFSTGGTADYLTELGIPVERIEDLSGYPSILGGRVKTLHPKVFGGILARRALHEDIQQLRQYAIPAIDLVVVDLYPFSETVHGTAEEEEIIEKIDIGGISLIRAAAKNYRDVLVIASREEYDGLHEILTAEKGISKYGQRKYFAKKAFAVSAAYDAEIYAWFNHRENFVVCSEPKLSLRYGENPHQEAAFYGRLTDIFEKLHGRELSYNNLVDIESCVCLMQEFRAEGDKRPVFAMIKHTNACGLARAGSLSEAWMRALACDPVSAFGAVLICNKTLDASTAEKMQDHFFEVLIAPAYDEDALPLLKAKKNRIILRQKRFDFPGIQYKSLLNGTLVQDRNLHASGREGLQYITVKHPSGPEIRDLLFAEKAVKHLKSNSIALVKDEQLIGAGMGQTSRVDALEQALVKVRNFGFDAAGAVMASEAFFPFPDCVEIAWNAGIRAVIQPGGSVRDQDSIAFCDAHDMAMVFSGKRHFKH